MNEKTANIENFIGIYNNYITEEDCNKAIKLFDDQNKFNKTMNRQYFEKVKISDKQDQQYFANAENINVWYSDLRPLLLNFDMALKHYEHVTGIKGFIGLENLNYTCLKIQKTLPTEGYHIWHVEHAPGFDHEPRVLAFSIYLNDVEEGGETEFLHFSKRVKPKRGRIVIWPAGFPYVHRGNPPLSGEKYLLTSWMLVR